MANNKYSAEVKQFASAIHRLTCNASHTDQCGWMYGEGQRTCDYDRVLTILIDLEAAGITPKLLHQLADILRPSTKEWRKYDAI